MKYSIIIPYRNRQSHLQMMIPRLQEFFKNESYEIIVSEQDDQENFRIACVENVGFNYSKGEIIILHQVDYYPTDDVSYEVHDSPVLPAKRGVFLSKDNTTERDYLDIPGGYRKWSEEIDPSFYGGVICMTRNHFEKINGVNPLYKGWGNEDEDLRERFVWAGIQVKRNEVGTFLCLYHEDNGDMSKKIQEHQKDFFDGREYFYKQAYNDRHIGYRNLKCESKELITDLENVRWIKSKNYKIENL
jgi:glycosyltransferase involved in cell wall biosynthesis